MKAKAARFYGWSVSDIESMPFSLFYEYFRAIELVNSEEALHNIEVGLAGHLTKEARKQLFKKHEMKIKMLVDRTEGRQANVEDVAKAFARMGNFGSRQPNNN